MKLTGAAACIFPSSELQLEQRRWQNIVTGSKIFQSKFDSLCFLHEIMVGIQRVVKDCVLLLMALSLSQCQKNNVKYLTIYNIQRRCYIMCIKEQDLSAAFSL
jgi:hypothetical protein